MTPHHATVNVMPGKQQTMPENRLLHAAIEIITAVVTIGKSSLVLDTESHAGSC